MRAVACVAWHMARVHGWLDTPCHACLIANALCLACPSCTGWWHCVLNLTPSIAITHNYVGEHNLLQVLDYLRNRPQCISGVPPARRSQLLAQFEQALERYSSSPLPRLPSPLSPPPVRTGGHETHGAVCRWPVPCQEAPGAIITDQGGTGGASGAVCVRLIVESVGPCTGFHRDGRSPILQLRIWVISLGFWFIDNK